MNKPFEFFLVYRMKCGYFQDEEDSSCHVILKNVNYWSNAVPNLFKMFNIWVKKNNNF